VGKHENKMQSVNSFNNRSKASKEKWESVDYQKKVSNGRKKMWENSSEEVKKKMLANLNHTGLGGKSRSKKVECIETHMIYNSTREAERLTGISHSNISLVCNGKRKTAGKFHWRYIEK